MASRYERSTSYQPTGADMARAQTAGKLASVLSQFSQSAASRYRGLQAERGARAGSQTSGTPQLKSTLTSYGRAFNDAALRNYVISKYTEAETELARIEGEARDPEEFRAGAQGVQRGALKAALPEARSALGEIYTKRIGEGIVRLEQKRITDQKATNRAVLQQGLETVSDAISRKLSSGDPALMMESEEDELRFSLMIDGAVASGDLAPSEAVTLKAEGVKRVTTQILTGAFEREVRAGNPVDFIGRVMQQPVENLSDAEKQTLVKGLYERLNRYQALASESAQLDTAEQKARWAKSEREATVKALRRQLTLREIADLTADDNLDPSVARTLEGMITSPQKTADDPAMKFAIETNLLAYSEADIAGAGSLSHETRADLILKRRQEAETWRNDQGAQEALRRIDVALGIPAGLGPQFMISVTPEKATAAAQARSYFYDLVEATPEEERRSKYFELADKSVKEVGKSVKRTDLASQQRALDAYLKQVGRPEDMSEDERKDYDATVKRRTDRIKALEQEIAR